MAQQSNSIVSKILKYFFLNFAHIPNRKVDDDGFSQHWNIKANAKKDKARTNLIEITGTCCWVITDRHGETEEFGLGEKKQPRIAYIKTIKTKKCA